MEYQHIISTRRPNNDGSFTEIYDSIESEVMVDDRGSFNTSISQANDISLYSIFLPACYKDIKIWDHISWTDFFGDENTLKVTTRDFIDFSLIAPYIELTCIKL